VIFRCVDYLPAPDGSVESLRFVFESRRLAIPSEIRLPPEEYRFVPLAEAFGLMLDHVVGYRVPARSARRGSTDMADSSQLATCW
jgi:hypothetical protein